MQPRDTFPCMAVSGDGNVISYPTAFTKCSVCRVVHEVKQPGRANHSTYVAIKTGCRSGLYTSHVMRKPTLCHTRKAKAQISLRIPRNLISAFVVPASIV